MHFFAIPFLFALVTSATLSTEAAESEGASFVDTFATFNKERWYISKGWSNGPYQNCMWSNRNVRLIKGQLELKIEDNQSKEWPFSCAEVQSRKMFGYGTYEGRIRSVAASGAVTSFFTFVGPALNKKYPHDEIDIELLGRNSNSVQLNYFSDGIGHHEHHVPLTFNAAAFANNYAIEWLPNSIRWFINGKLVHEVLGGPGVRIPSEPSKIFLHVWNGKGENMEAWLGKFEYPGRPLVASYEFVAFTKAGESCQFPESIVCNTSSGDKATKK